MNKIIVDFDEQFLYLITRIGNATKEIPVDLRFVAELPRYCARKCR